ncbi:SHOCT domain-containing protein [Terracoccus sp. 273MFTsu3.1]|uniref:SHOCT domain-containing protein n=1 Tax=Terracoccus sp. 273MFTsu3.1 TaxID=1172188 RepID=UPI0009DBA6CF|nr:SHOCT domain-containing protein [Terracoccus sp. 273MFTsu3.1]
MMWNTGMGSTPWMWLVMGGGTVAFWAAVVFAVRWAFGGPRGTVPSPGASRTEEITRIAGHGEDPSRPAGPLEVLQARLARGEIDVDEYARTRNALVESDPRLGRDRSRTTPE